MSKLDTFIQEKQQRTEEWKAQKTAEREDLNTMSDQIIVAVTQEPDAYLHYLDVQSDNPRYSASNVLLAIMQNPETSVFNSLKVWNDMGRSVAKDESGMKIRVSDTYVKDGQEYHGYKIGRVFDISQTTGTGRVPKTSLQENTPQMDNALRQLLDTSPVKVTTNTMSNMDAYYDPRSQEITVSTNLSDAQTFSALAREIVHASIHNHGKYPYYEREASALDADSVSYMLCRSYGIPCKQPDASGIAAMFGDLEPQDRRGILDSLQQIYRKLQGSVQRGLSPMEKKPEHDTPTR